MKTKKFEKKLALNKKTIADLKNDEMKKLQGGVVDTLPRSCSYCATACHSSPCC